jgi:hypothetical protein
VTTGEKYPERRDGPSGRHRHVDLKASPFDGVCGEATRNVVAAVVKRVQAEALELIGGKSGAQQ